MFTRQACAIAALTLIAGSANAQILDGGIKGGKKIVANAAGYKVRALEATVVQSVGPDTVNVELHDALNNQGFGTDDGWNLQFDYMNGVFELDANYAWIDNAPAMNYDGISIGAQATPGLGGSAFAISYDRGTGDPAYADLRWIQVVRSNDPLAFDTKWGQTYAADPGFTWVLDNGYFGNNDPTNPFYGSDDNNLGTGFAADGDSLLDRPRRFNADAYIEWEATAYLATWDTANKNITVYDGVNWGFQIFAPGVPTPGAIAILSLAGVTAARRRRSI